MNEVFLCCRLISFTGDTGRDITKENCSQLLCLEAEIKESLRFYPAVPMLDVISPNINFVK